MIVFWDTSSPEEPRAETMCQAYNLAYVLDLAGKVEE